MIINKCVENKKNFMIYLCPCVHQGINSKYEFKTCDEWILYLKEKLFSLSNYKIEFIVDNKMPDKCPIIIGKRKN